MFSPHLWYCYHLSTHKPAKLTCASSEARHLKSTPQAPHSHNPFTLQSHLLPPFPQNPRLVYKATAVVTLQDKDKGAHPSERGEI